MGKGEKGMCNENKNVRKIVVVYNNSSEKELLFTDKKVAMETWYSLFDDLEDIKTIELYTKIGDVFRKKFKYVTETDTLKLI